MHIHICVHVRLSFDTYILFWSVLVCNIHTYTHTYMYIDVYIYVHIHTCMYISICVHTHSYTHTYTYKSDLFYFELGACLHYPYMNISEFAQSKHPLRFHTKIYIQSPLLTYIYVRDERFQCLVHKKNNFSIFQISEL